MNTLKLAVQKSGRLSDSSLKLIEECGIAFPKQIARLKAKAFNFPVEFLYLRDDDIPGYVADNVADVGIVGENVLLEKTNDLEVVKRLGFSKCRLSIAVPKDFDYQGIKGFSNEVVEKLQKVRPSSVGQASRISGVTPAAISLLLVALERHKKAS